MTLDDENSVHDELENNIVENSVQNAVNTDNNSVNIDSPQCIKYNDQLD
jgi:hypothetical protein